MVPGITAVIIKGSSKRRWQWREYFRLRMMSEELHPSTHLVKRMGCCGSSSETQEGLKMETLLRAFAIYLRHSQLPGTEVRGFRVGLNIINVRSQDLIYSQKQMIFNTCEWIGIWRHTQTPGVMGKKKELLPELFHFQRYLSQNGMTKIQPRISSSPLILGNIIHDVVASQENGYFQ